MADGLFGGGSGSASNPYLVEDAKDFFVARRGSSYYKQVDDIDFTGVPILMDNNDIFRGNYDGNYHKLINYISNRDYNGSAVFHQLSNAVVQNVFIENCILTGSIYTAGLAVNATNSTIERCYVKGDLESYRSAFSTSYIGGLVAVATNSTIRDCYFEGSLSYRIPSFQELEEGSRIFAGGIIGNISGTNEQLVTIENCYFYGSIEAFGQYVEPYSSNFYNLPLSVINSFYDLEKKLDFIGGGSTTIHTISDLNVTEVWDFLNVWIETSKYPDLRIPDGIVRVRCKSTPFPLDIRKMILG